LHKLKKALNVGREITTARKTAKASKQKFRSFISYPLFFGRGVGAKVLGGLEISHGQQQSQVVMLAPHQGGTKQGRRCSHSIQSYCRLHLFLGRLPGRFPVGVASRTCLANL